MRNGLETVDADLLARLLGGALNQRAETARADRLRVMRENTSTLARLAPADEMTALAAGLNRLGRDADGHSADDVVFIDRWAAATTMERASGF
jgi:hypothetical protein